MLKQLPIKLKLGLMVAPACIALFILSSSVLFDNKQVMNEALHIEQLVKLTNAGSALVHELQKERGASAGYIGSKGTNFTDILRSQRNDTDQKLSQWKQSLQSVRVEISDQKLLGKLDQALSNLNKIDSTRRQISALSLPLGSAVSYYTDINALFLESVLDISNITSDAQVTASLFNFYNFVSSKERAGIERAVLSGVFSANKFSDGQYKRFITLVTEQDTYMDTFLASANASHTEFYDRAMSSSAVNNVINMRNTADVKHLQGNFDIDPKSWFSAATGRINGLKSVEDMLSSGLMNLSIELYESASTSFYTLLSVLIVVFALLVYLMSSLYSLIGRQITSLIETMKKVTENRDLKVRSQQITQDELGNLANSFNQMLATFSSAMDEISQASTQLSSASEETNQVLETNKVMMEQQHMQSEQVANATDQMAITVQEIARNTTHAADTAKEINSTASRAASVVQSNTQGVNALSKDVESIGTVIAQMHENSASINNVVEVIKSIADQTNLLALNAAIEAARAGEQGRGFAVVADEVRTLAMRTQDSTSEIDSIISQFKNTTDQAFSAIQAGTQMASKVANDAGSVETVLTEIVDSINDITAMMDQIATAATEQSATTEEINSSVGEINQGITEAATTAEQIQSVGRDQAQLAVQMQNLAQAFN